MTVARRLSVAGARAEDASRGVARLDPADLAARGVATGALVAIRGSRTACARALPRHPAGRGGQRIQIDGAIRGNAGTTIGETVEVAPASPAAAASRVALSGPQRLPAAMLRRALAGVPLCRGDRFRAPLLQGGEADPLIDEVHPTRPMIVGAATERAAGAPHPDPADGHGVRYQDLGGLGRVLRSVREVVGPPLRNRAGFDHLGITPPKGVPQVGPPGTSDTRIVHAAALGDHIGSHLARLAVTVVDEPPRAGLARWTLPGWPLLGWTLPADAAAAPAGLVAPGAALDGTGCTLGPSGPWPPNAFARKAIADA